MKNISKILAKYSCIFIICGLIYICIELFYRQYTTPEMFFLAGICGVLWLAPFNNHTTYETDFLFQSITCGTLCTFAEWLCGVFFNMDYHIWNYCNLPFSTPDGQINLFFWMLWCVISAIAIPILDWIEYQYFDYMPETPPYYKICGRKVYQMKPKKGNAHD